jgi:hypothetical protein
MGALGWGTCAALLEIRLSAIKASPVHGLDLISWIWILSRNQLSVFLITESLPYLAKPTLLLDLNRPR